MRKFVRALVLALVGVALASFVGCNLPSVQNVQDLVQYPEQYSITYEIESKDGTVTKVQKIVDGQGNVYFKSGDAEKLFIKDGNQYTLYEKDESGAFAASADATYVQTYVTEQTKVFSQYAEMSRNQMMPTAKQSGTATVLGRECLVYTISVGGANTGVHYSYFVDKQTGICMGYDSGMSALGFEMGADGDVFRCTEFETENIASLSDLIK